MKRDKLITQKIALHWIHIVLLLFCFIIGGTLVLGYLVESLQLFKIFDAFFYTRIAGLPRIPWFLTLIWPLDHYYIPFIKPYPNFFVILNISLLIYIYFKKRSLFWWSLLTLIIASLLAALTLFINTELLFRERPFYSLPNNVDEQVRNGLKSWTSFPSGHARDTAMYATIFAAYIPRMKLAMIALSLLVAFSRVYLGFHYPTDVIAGLFFGFLVAKVTLILVRELQIIVSKRRSGNDHFRTD